MQLNEGNNNGKLYIWIDTTGSTPWEWAQVSNTTFTVGQWYHVALVRNGNNIILYVNGQQDLTAAITGSIFTNSTPVYIGRSQLSTRFFTGAIHDFRIVVGTAVYTANFNPPTTSLTAIANTRFLSLRNKFAAQSYQALDESKTSKMLIRNNNPSIGSFSPFPPDNAWSVGFDGASDYLTYTSPSVFPAPISFLNGASGFGTFECWIWPDQAPTASQNFTHMCILGLGGTFLNFGLRNNRCLRFYWWGGSQLVGDGVTPLTLNTWNHVAFTRNGNTVTIWLNGVADGSPFSMGGISWATASDGNSLYIGHQSSADQANPWRGYIADARFTNAVLYTSTFVPPTSQLTTATSTGTVQTLICSGRDGMYDKSVNNYAWIPNDGARVTNFSRFAPDAEYNVNLHGGSALFNGSDSSYSLTNNFGLDFAGDFTIEAWVYSTANNGNYKGVIECRAGALGQNWVFGLNGMSVDFYGGGEGANRVTSATPVRANCWNHIAATRIGSTIRVYLNGRPDANTMTRTGVIGTNTAAPLIGRLHDGSTVFPGFISNVRVTNGTALYGTTAFTLPSAPFSKVTNSQTSLLLTFDNNIAISDRSATFNLFHNGDTRISRTIKTIGNGSIYFDGAGDYLETPSHPNINFAGNLPWTVECWLRPSGDYGIYRTVFAKRVSGTGTTSWEGYLRITTGVISFYNGANYESSVTLAANQWSHCAWVYDGTNIRIFVNGVQALSQAISITETALNEPLIIAGARGHNEWYQGYMYDFRITKGVARYTANFTAPTQPNYLR
jgi:hypothetical protein